MVDTPLNITMSPKKGPFQKESSLPAIISLEAMLVCSGATIPQEGLISGGVAFDGGICLDSK